MPIPESLLDRRVHVLRLVVSRTSTGDQASKRSRWRRNQKIRICRNTKNEPSGITDAGLIVTSTHKGFTLSTSGIETGDILVDTMSGEMYEVKFVDGRPGGMSGHHLEIYMNHAGVGGGS